jgi:hypothetical protein
VAYANEDPVNNTDVNGQQLIAGALWGGGADLLWQLSQNGWDIRCVDPWLVARGAAIGAAFGAAGKVFSALRGGVGRPPTSGPYGPIPRPPGWNENWWWRGGETVGSKGRAVPRWVDEAGGHWSWGEDATHIPHWDYNPWRHSTDKWINRTTSGQFLPKGKELKNMGGAAGAIGIGQGKCPCSK